MIIFSSKVQFSKAPHSMLLIFLDKTNCFKDMQLLNVYRCIAVILSGIFILFSDVQPEKAPYAIPRSAILSGITSVSNEEQPENDKLSISFTSPLKLTFFRLSQFVKENCFIVLGSCMLSNEIHGQNIC